MEKRVAPRLTALIREAECIGCTKCIQACPFDAIAGAAKWMHTVITAECIGCKLCVAPCPVDCIDIVALPEEAYQTTSQERATLAKQRYLARKKRLVTESKLPFGQIATDKNAYILAAVERARMKKALK